MLVARVKRWSLASIRDIFSSSMEDTTFTIAIKSSLVKFGASRGTLLSSAWVRCFNKFLSNYSPKTVILHSLWCSFARKNTLDKAKIFWILDSKGTGLGVMSAWYRYFRKREVISLPSIIQCFSSSLSFPCRVWSCSWSKSAVIAVATGCGAVVSCVGRGVCNSVVVVWFWGSTRPWESDTKILSIASEQLAAAIAKAYFRLRSFWYAVFDHV